MRIKHWQGYGTVEAKKVYQWDNGDGIRYLNIKVTGNHEWGLVRHDDYDLERWLVKRFCKGYRYLIDYQIESGYERINGLYVETALYRFAIQM